MDIAGRLNGFHFVKTATTSGGNNVEVLGFL